MFVGESSYLLNICTNISFTMLNQLVEIANYTKCFHVDAMSSTLENIIQYLDSMGSTVENIVTAP